MKDQLTHYGLDFQSVKSPPQQHNGEAMYAVTAGCSSSKSELFVPANRYLSR